MAFDGVLLNCILKQLRDEIIGGRIDRIYQPEKDEIHIGIRLKNKDNKMLISASPNYPRIHLTRIQKNNPISPPVFCMVLRKHLLGGRVFAIEQPNFERILVLSIECRDELGDLSLKRLVVEIMGRHSNIILVDEKDHIIDSIKRITGDISRVRQVLPGKLYSFPPSQNKQNPLVQDEKSLEGFFTGPMDTKKATRMISDNFTGVSRVTAKEIVYRAGAPKSMVENAVFEPVGKEGLITSFYAFFEKVKEERFEPNLLKDEDGRPLDVFPFPFYQFSLDLQNKYDSISDALDIFFEVRDKMDRVRQRTSHLFKVLNTNLDRAQKKRGILLDEYSQAKEADQYKLFGELITANLYQIPKGTEKVELVNYYDPESRFVEIKLDKRKTPSQNAQRYYKKYAKAKKALIMIKKQLEDTENEIQYLEAQLDNLGKCTEESEIQEIRQELAQEGYIRLRNEKKSFRKLAPSKPYHYISSDGFDIYVGKNNTQNDRLTIKTAEQGDLWLHAKDIPGSHVIVKSQGKEIPEQTLLEAGMLAAFFSKAKHSSKVPVDYCLRKNVRKPSGAKPGMVIYDNYNTMFVTPDEGEINSLKMI